jgi:hypothetical protein
LIKQGGKYNAGVLHEVPNQERDERRKEHHHEERETGDAGSVLHLRDQDVPDWQGLEAVKRIFPGSGRLLKSLYNERRGGFGVGTSFMVDN